MNITIIEATVASELFKMIGSDLLILLFLLLFIVAWVTMMGIGFDSAIIIALSLIIIVAMYGTMGNVGIFIVSMICSLIVLFAILKLVNRR